MRKLDSGRNIEFNERFFVFFWSAVGDVEVVEIYNNILSVYRVYYYYSSNLRAHGVCDYGTLPVM